jgi:RNA polymerase sigma-70 factor, ECF subfamily
MSQSVEPLPPENTVPEHTAPKHTVPEHLAPEEVAAMYVAHGEQLRRFLLGVLRDAAAAADCLQLTFTRLLERGHEAHPGARRAWLYKVAFQEAMLLKRRTSAGDRALRKAAWSRKQPTEEPLQPLLRVEAVERIGRLLAELPEEQRQVVRMRIYDDKTFAVISQELGIPLGTALGRMRLALKKLRKSLDGESFTS